MQFLAKSFQLLGQQLNIFFTIPCIVTPLSCSTLAKPCSSVSILSFSLSSESGDIIIKVAAPAAALSSVNAAILTPPSLPRNNISLSEVSCLILQLPPSC